MNLVVLPVLFDENGKPKDQWLVDAVEGWASGELGRNFKVEPGARTWVAIEIDGDAPSAAVRGFCSVRYSPDITLHAAGKKESVKLIGRMRDYLSDNGLSGVESLVYVDPSQEEVWREFFKSKGAVPANRWILKPGTGVEDVLRKRPETGPPESDRPGGGVR